MTPGSLLFMKSTLTDYAIKTSAEPFSFFVVNNKLIPSVFKWGPQFTWNTWLFCLMISFFLTLKEILQKRKSFSEKTVQTGLADPVERTVREYSDRSLTVLRPFSDLALLWLRTIKKHLKHFNYDSVAKFGIEGVEINTIILFFSYKNYKNNFY